MQGLAYYLSFEQMTAHYKDNIAIVLGTFFFCIQFHFTNDIYK